MRISYILFATSIVIVVCIFASCRAKHNYRAGGPYYYRTGVTYEGFFPCDEMSKAEAEVLASNGNAYYIAYFNNSKQPILIEKHYKNEIEKVELFYSEGRLIKTVLTGLDGVGKELPANK